MAHGIRFEFHVSCQCSVLCLCQLPLHCLSIVVVFNRELYVVAGCIAKCHRRMGSFGHYFWLVVQVLVKCFLGVYGEIVFNSNVLYIQVPVYMYYMSV